MIQSFRSAATCAHVLRRFGDVDHVQISAICSDAKVVGVRSYFRHELACVVIRMNNTTRLSLDEHAYLSPSATASAASSGHIGACSSFSQCHARPLSHSLPGITPHIIIFAQARTTRRRGKKNNPVLILVFSVHVKNSRKCARTLATLSHLLTISLRMRELDPRSENLRVFS